MNRLLAAILFFAAHVAFSQRQVRFERITVEDGLSQSSIKTMIQDKYGYLWIGTLDGLNKYDGNKFYVYQYEKGNQRSIPRNDIHRLFIDSAQNLWVSTAGYLSLFVPERNNFTHYTIEIDGKVNAGFIVNDLHQHSDSILLLATNKGIWEFNTTTGRFARNKKYNLFDTEEVRNFCITNDGSIWISTYHKLFVSNTNQPIANVMTSDKRIEFHYSRQSDEIYVQSVDSLSKFDHHTKRFKKIFSFSKTAEVDESHMRLLKLANDELWVMRREVIVFDSSDHYQKTLRYIQQDPFALSSDYLACIYETKDGVVWIGTNGMGLNKYSPQFSVFNYYGHFPGAPVSLSNNFITSIATENDNEIYVGTTDGLDILQLKQNTTSHYDITSKNGRKARINKLARNTNGDLWIATSKGLRKWNGKEIQFTGVPFLDDPSTMVNDLDVFSYYELMIATTSGIFIFNTKTKKLKNVIEKGSSVIKLIDTMLWAELFEHVMQYDTTHYALLHDYKNNPADSNSFPDATIKCFYQDKEDKVWIGTSGGGLTVYDPTKKQFTNFTEKHGLPNNVVYGILEDDSNNLWLSTNKGIAVFSKKELRCIRNYNATHGLQGDEFNTNAYYQSRSGTMYFGGVDGLTVFRPKEALSINSEIPKCIITGLYVNGEREHETSDHQSLSQIIDSKNVELSWNERNFGFEISSLGFSYPAHTSYQYMLQNYDDSWTLLENERRIQFTNIPPGNYILRIKASNSFGEWEEEGVVIGVRINPPLWRTAWFIALVLVFVISILYTIFQWRTRALRNQTILLESLVKDRTRALQVQQEEIAAQNEELTAQSELMDHRNAELEKIKTTLEQRVEERTDVLQQVNKELVNQNTQLEQFAFITAHNIRGPIARIKGLINLLKNNDNEVQDLLKASVNNLDEVISDLGIVLSIRKGVGNLTEHVELRAQLQLTINMLTDEITKVGGQVDITQFQPVYIDGLRPYVHSIFYNLIHNALKYSSNERPIYISCSNIINEGRVKIIVEDNGIGIDMRYAKDKIFNLYQRFHPEVGGKGFGLFLTRTQVEAMHGSITVESSLKAGSRFIIEFPVSTQH